MGTRMYQHAVIRALRCDYCVGLPPDIVQVWHVTIHHVVRTELHRIGSWW